jgi:two-component system sensor histidine kinase KdpD
MGAADSLKDSDLSIELRRELYGEIFIASVRLNRLIENLLNMSRLESGRLSLRKDWYDLNDLFYQVFENLKDELSSHKLVAEIQDDLPLVKIDFGILGQVLHNLIINAIQHTPAETEIKLDAHFSDSSLSISVSDNGPGFPTDAVSNVFDKFNKAGKSGGGGPGLGLSIVKGFTEAHGGDVFAGNNPDGGATVKIKLPVEFSDIKSLKISIDE